jgi:formylglycine-generating enzyme required for sulfatase activity
MVWIQGQMKNMKSSNPSFGFLALVACLSVAVVSSVFFASVTRGQDSAAPESRKRVALVIGNGSYPLSAVDTAPADAKAIAELLGNGGFEVVHVENARRIEMESAIKEFSKKLERGAVAVVYFSGYAIPNQDRNFLIPVDAKISSDDDVRSNAIDVDLILDPLIVARLSGSVVILDAARKTPWQEKTGARSAGLANLMPIQGIIQVYPSGPGQIVGDQASSLFAKELVNTAKVPDRTFKEAFQKTRAAVAKASHNRQVPWETSGGSVDFVITPRAELVKSHGVSPLGSADPVELGFWETIKDSDSPANFEAYLDAYPSGRFASAARARLLDIASNKPAKPLADAPTSIIRDCLQCPELVFIPSGSFKMGSTEVYDFEGPVHQVSIPKGFYLGRYEVTYDEWDACVADRGCKFRPDDAGAGRGRRPVTNLDWNDAKTYLAWLSEKTAKAYRLPTESEWEYAARANTTTAYPWGRSIEKDRANCAGCTSEPLNKPIEVGSFKPNAFGVYDMAGNAAEWVEDCWSDGYREAPTDGSAIIRQACNQRVLRGGSFNNDAKYSRSAARFRYDFNVRHPSNGLRVVREKTND